MLNNERYAECPNCGKLCRSHNDAQREKTPTGLLPPCDLTEEKSLALWRDFNGPEDPPLGN